MNVTAAATLLIKAMKVSGSNAPRSSYWWLTCIVMRLISLFSSTSSGLISALRMISISVLILKAGCTRARYTLNEPNGSRKNCVSPWSR